MSPDKWLDQYYQGEYFSGNFSHLKMILGKLGITKKNFKKIITIGGTNGKGETSRLVYEYLRKNRYKAALWTSPHLESVIERFDLANEDSISKEDLTNVFNEVKSWLDVHDFKLSYFEFLFVSFMRICKQRKMEYIVLEVGLGGRLDAVNTFSADICAITSISRDHQDLLGNRYEDILREKLGITRNDNILITCFELSYLREKTKNYISNGEWIDLFNAGQVTKDDHFSLRNQKLAKQILKTVFKGEEIDIDIYQTTPWRYFIQKGKTKCFFFPSHNPDGIRKLVQFLNSGAYQNITGLFMAFSERSESDLTTMVKSILNLKVKDFCLYHFLHEKALGHERLQNLGQKFNLEIVGDKSFSEKIDFNNEQIFLFTGSNYFLGDVYQLLVSSN